VSELDRHRHQLRRFVASKAEHHPLVTGATGVDALGDVGRLLLDGDDHAAGFGIEAEARVVVTGLLDGVANDVAHLDVGVGRDLADDEGQPGGDGGLAGHATERVLGHDGVEDGVRDLVGDLVGVALGDGL